MEGSEEMAYRRAIDDVRKTMGHASKPIFKEAVMPSVTSMYDCTHGPKANCHACLIREFVKRLERASVLLWDCAEMFPRNQRHDILDAHFEIRAVLEKAKLIEDCVPIDEASEAAASQGRWR